MEREVDRKKKTKEGFWKILRRESEIDHPLTIIATAAAGAMIGRMILTDYSSEIKRFKKKLRDKLHKSF
jgi:hypothetical protein